MVTEQTLEMMTSSAFSSGLIIGLLTGVVVYLVSKYIADDEIEEVVPIERKPFDINPYVKRG